MKSIFSTILFLLHTVTGFSQSVGIGTNAPNPSAILDIRSSSKGVLLPKVNLQSVFDTFTIPHPATGLIVYNTNMNNFYDGAGYYVWNGGNWDVLISSGNAFKRGKNRYLTFVDGDVREYIVHTPKDYNPSQPTPVVFMLHGTGGDGERFYNSSGWKEVGDDENILTVFPTSWKYLYADNGDTAYHTKWNVLPDASFTLLNGQTGRNDIKFLNRIVAEMKIRFNVDTSRIYIEGFSNGGQMAAKCAVEMSNTFAAVAENAGTFYLQDTTYTPQRKLPILFEIGNEDFGPGVTGIPYDLNKFDSLLRTAGNFYYNAKHAHMRNFGIDSVFTLSGSNFGAKIADFHGTPGDTLNVYKMVFVKGLGHQFPNGDNHWMEAAVQHWAWMKKFRKS